MYHWFITDRQFVTICLIDNPSAILVITGYHWLSPMILPPSRMHSRLFFFFFFPGYLSLLIQSIRGGADHKTNQTDKKQKIELELIELIIEK